MKDPALKQREALLRLQPGAGPMKMASDPEDESRDASYYRSC